MQILHILVQGVKKPSFKYSLENGELYAILPTVRPYWLLTAAPPPGWWGPCRKNIGGCNNFILSTDAERLLARLRSGCQWRLIASGCGKLIPEETSFICFSNSGKKY